MRTMKTKIGHPNVASNVAPMDPVTANPVMSQCACPEKFFGNLEESTKHDLAALFVTGFAAREAPKNTAQQYCIVYNCRRNEKLHNSNHAAMANNIGLSESMVPLCALVHHVFPN